MIRRLSLTATFCLLACVARASLIPPEVFPEDVNCLVALRSLENSLAFVAFYRNITFPSDGSGLGNWVNTATATGWNSTFTGHIGGVSFSFTDSGFVAGSNLSWSTIGSFGSETFTSNGHLDVNSTNTEPWNQGFTLGPTSVSTQGTFAMTTQQGSFDIIVHVLLHILFDPTPLNEGEDEMLKADMEATYGKLSSASTSKAGTIHSDGFVDVGTTKVVITGTPEPSTVALTALGFGGMVLMMFRNQKCANHN